MHKVVFGTVFAACTLIAAPAFADNTAPAPEAEANPKERPAFKQMKEKEPERYAAWEKVWDAYVHARAASATAAAEAAAALEKVKAAPPDKKVEARLNLHAKQIANDWKRLDVHNTRINLSNWW